MIKHNDDKYDEVSDEDGNVDEGEDANNEDDADQFHLVENSGNLTECPGSQRPSSGLEKRHIISGLLLFATICSILLYFVKFVLLYFALHCPFSGLEKRHII